MLREQRATMVQTEAQYRFIFYVISAFMRAYRTQFQFPVFFYFLKLLLSKFFAFKQFFIFSLRRRRIINNSEVPLRHY